jgi:hypothetical protein
MAAALDRLVVAFREFGRALAEALHLPELAAGLSRARGGAA